MALDNVYHPAAAGRTPDPATVQRLQKLAYWLDDRFHLPGTRMRLGLDGLLGLIPGVGDAAVGALSAYIIAEAWRLGVPPAKLARMGANWGIDFVIGSIPVVGDIFDIGWKANRKNIHLLLRHLEAEHGGVAPPAAGPAGGAAGTTPPRGRGL